jgi:hypothetical protein
VGDELYAAFNSFWVRDGELLISVMLDTAVNEDEELFDDETCSIPSAVGWMSSRVVRERDINSGGADGGDVMLEQ